MWAGEMRKNAIFLQISSFMAIHMCLHPCCMRAISTELYRLCSVCCPSLCGQLLKLQVHRLCVQVLERCSPRKSLADDLAQSGFADTVCLQNILSSAMQGVAFKRCACSSSFRRTFPIE